MSQRMRWLCTTTLRGVRAATYHAQNTSAPQPMLTTSTHKVRRQLHDNFVDNYTTTPTTTAATAAATRKTTNCNNRRRSRQDARCKMQAARCACVRVCVRWKVAQSVSQVHSHQTPDQQVEIAINKQFRSAQYPGTAAVQSILCLGLCDHLDRPSTFDLPTLRHKYIIDQQQPPPTFDQLLTSSAACIRPHTYIVLTDRTSSRTLLPPLIARHLPYSMK